jgi:hypothetical protein
MMSLLFSFLALLYSGICSVQGQTVLQVQFSQQAQSLLTQSQSADGTARMLLYLLENRRKNPEFPADGPFPLTPGPVIAWNLTQDQIKDAALKGLLSLQEPQGAFPGPFESISGRFRGQLALVLDGEPFGQREPMILKGPVSEFTLEFEQPQTLEMSVSGPSSEPSKLIHPDDRIEVITLRSPLLAQTGKGKEGQSASGHRALVILPNGYHELTARRRRWPVIYLIPGSETTLERARSIAKILHEPTMKDLVPQAIWVVLDPASVYGHHFFTDSELQGQRAQALSTELIPWLDVRFRTIPEADARLLVGEEQGGRAALTLLLDHPELFSNAWSLSPDAVSFEALGCLDLKRDQNAFLESDESRRPAIRTVLSEDREIVHMDVDDEILLSRTISPNGRSGGKWDELRAAFGSLQTRKDLARWPFDPETGQLRPAEVMHWMAQDLTERVRARPELAERLTNSARIFVGEEDERYRNLGVRMLQRTVEETLEDDGSVSKAWVVEVNDADRRSTNAISRLPIHDEMITVLRSRGHHD